MPSRPRSPSTWTPSDANAMASEEPEHLDAERRERDGVDHREQPQVEPARERLARGDEVRPPDAFAPPRQRRAMSRDPAVEPLRDGRDPGHAPVEPERPGPPRHDRERAEHRLGPLAHAAAGVHEHDGFPESLRGNVGEAGRRLGRGGVVHELPRGALPARDPAPAERAVAVEDEQGFHGRTLPIVHRRSKASPISNMMSSTMTISSVSLRRASDSAFSMS